MYVIYALVDPRDNTVHYIGITDDVYQRFMQHINCGSNNFAKNAWILGLRAANKMVIMETLEEVDTREQALIRETYWIKHFEMLKEPVMNVCQTTSPRQAKKTNLHLGRSMAIDMATTVVEAMTIAHMAYPVKQELPAQTKQKVGNGTRTIILRMYRLGRPLGEIAKAVGLTGRSYPLFKEVCRELDISKKVEDA